MNEWLPFIALAGLIIGLFAWLRNDIRELRQEHNVRLDALGSGLSELHKDIQAIDVRLARVEATLETIFRIQGVPPTNRDKAA